MSTKDGIPTLIPWGGCTPTAILQQLEARRQEAFQDGEEFVMVVAWAKKNKEGIWRYSESWTTGPAEILFYMAHYLKDRLKP